MSHSFIYSCCIFWTWHGDRQNVAKWVQIWKTTCSSYLKIWIYWKSSYNIQNTILVWFKNTASSYGDMRDYEELSDATLVCEENDTPHPSISLRGHWHPGRLHLLANMIDKDMSGDEDGNQTAKTDLTTVVDLMCDLMWGPSDDD